MPIQFEIATEFTINSLSDLATFEKVERLSSLHSGISL